MTRIFGQDDGDEATVLVERVELRAIHDPDPDLDWLLGNGDVNDPDPELRKHARQDRIRRRRWHRNEWWYVSLVVDVEVTIVDADTGNSITGRHTVGPLRDVPSDSSLVDVVDMWAGLVAELVDELAAEFTPDTTVAVASTPNRPESAHTVLVVAR